MSRPRVLLADDHQIVVEGLRSILEPEFDLVGTVGDGRALVETTQRLNPDVIVVDISMPLLNGIEAVRQIRKTGCEAKIVFLTMHPDVTYATRAMEAGADGYVLKHSAPSELVTAIRQTMAGEVYISPMIANDLRKRPVRTPLELTSRQREVLQLVAEGRSAAEISNVLNISPRTVEFHKYRMMQELSLHSSAELIQYAIKHGIVSV